MPVDGLPNRQLDLAAHAIYIWQRIGPRNDRLVRDKLRISIEQLRKDIRKAKAEIRFANRLNPNETYVEIAESEMWEQRIDDYAGKCYEILCAHWHLLGEKKTGAVVRVALEIILSQIEGLGRSAAHEVNRRHHGRGYIGTSPAGLYEDSLRAICDRWRTKLDIEARELDLAVASGTIPRILAHPVLGDRVINKNPHEQEPGQSRTQTENETSQAPSNASFSHRTRRILEKLEQKYRRHESADGIKKYVEEVDSFCDAEIDAGRVADLPQFWVAVYSDTLISVKAKINSLTSNLALKLMRTGGGKPGEQAEGEELLRELSRVAAEIERKLASAIEHAKSEQAIDQPQRVAGTAPTEPSPRLLSAPPEPEPAREKVTNERKPRIMPLLREKGWSINDWAVQSGVDFHTANRYLKGLSNPYQSTRRKLTKSLGILDEDLPR